MTAEDLWQIEDDFSQYELIRGELHVVAPAGGDYGALCGKAGRRIRNHVVEHKLGRIYQGETEFVLARNPDTTLVPDIVFVRADRIIRTPDRRGYLEQAPDCDPVVLGDDDLFDGEDVLPGFRVTGSDPFIV